jgi:type IV secretion system protein TrbE
VGMTNLTRIIKDYRDSGALHALVGIQSAVGADMFATKSGDLVMILRVRGRDYECLDPDQTDAIARGFESALRLLDDGYRLYQYVLKRDQPPLPVAHYDHPIVEEVTQRRRHFLQSRAESSYTFETYMAIVYEGARPRRDFRQRLGRLFAEPGQTLRQTFSADAAFEDLQRNLDEARDVLAQKAASLEVYLRDLIEVEILDTQAGFRFLRRLLNYAPFKAEVNRLRHAAFVDFQACDSALECHRDFLRLDDDVVQVLTLKEPPARTFAHVLRGLAELPCYAVIALEWKRADALRVRRLIQSKRRHFHNTKSSAFAYVGTNASASQDVLVDDGTVSHVANLGACLEEIEANGRYFGELSLTLVLYHKDQIALRHAVAQCYKLFATHDAQLTDERYNRLNAWLAVLPGNADYNLRRIWLTDRNCADLSFLYTLQSGQPYNAHLRGEALALLEGTAGTPYFLNLHYKDVAHTLILGATGSGKSFLLNFLLTHLQKYNPYTFIFDLGGSYESLTRLLNGSYLAIGATERSVTINPFCLPPTPENLAFLFSFVKVLVESNGYRATSDEERDLYEQIESLYAVAPDQRRLFTLSNIVHRNLRRELQKWVRGGPYAALFDNAEDTLTLARLQTFDFEGMNTLPAQLEPLLFYILHRANAAIADAAHAGTFKVFVMDEAWRFFRHPVIKAYIVEAFKTWRKKNAAMILATQSSDDLLTSEMLPVIAESCPTRLFLANPGMDAQAYRDAFHLNETELALIARLVPKRQLLLKQPDVAKLLNLHVDAREYWIYTNNPQDNQRRRDAFARFGFLEGLNQLAKEPL